MAIHFNKRTVFIKTEGHNFEAAYKKGTRDLIWVSCYALTPKEADFIMDAYIKRAYDMTYRRYAGALPIKN
jgi:hypothetical protein